MKRVITRILLVVFLAVLLAAGWLGYRINDEIERTRSEDPLVWEHAIAAFDSKTQSGKLPADAIIFIGSSSIRLWASLREDMAPIPVIQRGFGGAKINDLVHYTERLVAAPSPRALVVFAGSNDIQPGAAKDPQMILDSFREFVSRARAVHADIPIYYIAITPTPRRWEIWPISRAANALIEDFAASQEGLQVIDTTAGLLGPDGSPDPDNYLFDNLHLGTEGYAIWAGIIRPRLLADFPHYR